MMELLNWIDAHGWTAFWIFVFAAMGVAGILDRFAAIIRAWRKNG
jgi:hypothetical protein